MTAMACVANKDTRIFRLLRPAPRTHVSPRSRPEDYGDQMVRGGGDD